MNSLSCHAQYSPKVTNRALGPTIGPGLQFTKSSGYNRVDEERLKLEQSATTDLPMHALTIDMREGILAASATTIRSPFGEAPAVHFRRTAHALATLEPQTKKEQEATMGCLPAFISKISLGIKKEKLALCSTTPRRQLLPPPKTVFLPCEDPVELRQIIEEMQQKRSQSLANARITSRLQALDPLDTQTGSSGWFFAVPQFKSLVALNINGACKRLGALLGDLIDKLAVA